MLNIRKKKIDTVILKRRSYVISKFERYSAIYSDITNDTLLATFLSVDTPLLILA